jgi:DNA-binding winged helix-turn-helix (wHTH) protein
MSFTGEAALERVPASPALARQMDPAIRFGDVVVDPATRTVARAGHCHHVEPKVFDLIVHLMKHHDRVVTRHELLDVVWGTRVCVTDGVVTRTVMKARRLIGGDTDDGLTIRTVHRIGYRLVGPAGAAAQPSRSAVAAASPVCAAAGSGSRIAVLPFEDRTGNPELSWIDVGLMSATKEAIAASIDVAMVPTREVMAVVGAHTAGADSRVTAEQAQIELAASDVVQASVTQDSRAWLTIRYRGAGRTLGSLQGELTGPDPFDLSHRLAMEIKQCVAGTTLATPASGGNGLQGPVLGVVRALAMKAILGQRWEVACKLLQAALEISPNDVALKIYYARCLLQLRESLAPGSSPPKSSRRRRRTARSLTAYSKRLWMRI